MKKANLKKVLFILMVGIVMLFALSVEEQADTAMIERLNVANNNGIMPLAATSSEAGIYQTALNAYVDTNIKIDSSIANTRTKFGKKEIVKVRFSFSKAIDSNQTSGLKLILKFGEKGTEHVVKNPDINGSYIDFSYTLKEGDNGGLVLVAVEGNVSDGTSNIPTIGLLDKQNTWRNEIIADTVAPSIKRGDNEANHITSNEKIYILENGKIRPIQHSDIYINTNIETGAGRLEQASSANVIIEENNFKTNGSNNITDPGKVCIPNAVDIAGNPLQSLHEKTGDMIEAEVIGVSPINGKYYCKSGVNIKITIKHIKSGASVFAKFYNTTDAGGAYEKVEESTAEERVFYYTIRNIEDWDNGKLTVRISEGNCLCGQKIPDIEKSFDNIIADTTEPKVSTRFLDLLPTSSVDITHTNSDGTTSTDKLLETKSGWLTEEFTKANDKNKKVTKGAWSEYAHEVAPNNNEDAIIFLKEGRPEIAFDVSDANIGLNSNAEQTTVSNVECTMKLGEEIQVIDTKKENNYISLQAKNKIEKGTQNGHKVLNATCKATDYAGNSTEIKDIWDKGLRIVYDWEAPEVTVTEKEGKTSTNSDTVEFKITFEDAKFTHGSEELYGSGIESRSIDLENIVVENGTILKKTDSHDANKNHGTLTTTVTVLPGVDGYVSLYVKEGAVMDHCDNPSKASNVGKVLVDRTAPVIHDVTGVPTDWTDKATLSVIASDMSEPLKYSFDDGENWSERNQKEVFQNGEVKIKVKDSLGNESATKIVNITKIDKTVPTINGVDYHQGWTNQDVEVTINAKDDDSGIKEYSFDGGKTWQASPKKIYTTTNTIAANNIKVRDKIGNEQTWGQSEVIQIDKIAPTIDTIAVNPEGSTEDGVNITVYAGDEGGSGVAGFSFDGKAYTNTNSYTVTKNGDVTIQVKDAAGNVTSIVKTINNIVETKPKVTLSNNGGKFVMPTEGKAKIKSTITVDSKSNCTVYYGVSTTTTPPASYQTTQGNKVDVELEVAAEGTYYVWAYAVNEKGNPAEPVSSEFVVSKSEITLTPSTTEETTNPVVVSVQYGDGLTENRKAGFGDEITANVTQVTVTENGTVYAEATDIAGNKVYKRLEINNIKKNEQVTFDQGADKFIKEVKVIGDKGYLIVNPKTTAEQLKTNVITNYEKTVENTVAEEQLKTGSSLKIGTVNSEYTIVVKGDANCDGKVEFSDIVKINSIRLEKLAIANVPYEVQLASDVDGNGKIEFSDIVKINSYRLGKTNTL